MKKAAYRRINITLPESTVEILESVADKGERSAFIDEAIRGHAKTLKRANLRQLLKEGAMANRDRDLAIAEEWFPLEEELWQE